MEVQWPAAPHATRYRVQVRGFGENDFTAAATVHDPQTLLSELPEGQFMEVRVISANAVDEAAPSPVVMVAVR